MRSAFDIRAKGRPGREGWRRPTLRAGSAILTAAVIGTGTTAWAGGSGFMGLGARQGHRTHSASETRGSSPRVFATPQGLVIAPAGAAAGQASAGGAQGEQAHDGFSQDSAPTSPAQYGQTPVPATGQITAHDGDFWLGSTRVLMHGMCIAPLNYTDTPTEPAYTQIQGWHMNFVRMRIQWRDMELVPPIKVGNSWVHTYNSFNLSAILEQIGWATSHGQYVLIQDTLMAFWPAYLYLPTYNSHHKTYLNLVDLETDFWSDSLMQQFLREYWQYMATQLKNVNGIVGYEAIDEPNPGNLPLTVSNEALILNVQYATAQAIRAIDPPRVFFFTTHDSLGAGLPQANLTQWKSFGNVVFDLHGYGGARWGVGLITDPADPNYGEVNGTLLNFTITEETPPYLGTTLGQYRFVQYFLSFLGQPGVTGSIPLIVAEFGGKAENESNMMTLIGTMTQAFNMSNISWAVWSWNGQNGVRKLDGTPLPWTSILSSAALYRG